MPSMIVTFVPINCPAKGEVYFSFVFLDIAVYSLAKPTHTFFEANLTGKVYDTA